MRFWAKIGVCWKIWQENYGDLLLDFDLSEPAANNRNWRDFLRAYEFNLPFEPPPDRSYILEVTCLTPNGKRLAAECPLKQPK